MLIRTTNGSPVILNQLVDLKIMSESWAKAHGALEPQNYIAKEESYAARHANGTGPFRLVTREEDVKTIFAANHDWWDEKNRSGNVETAMTAKLSPHERVAVMALPIPTLYGEDKLMDPADIANSIVFLVSQQAHGINGIILFCDGGTDALLNTEKVY